MINPNLLYLFNNIESPENNFNPYNMGKKYGALETPFMNDTESPSNVEMVMN
jgi:hypothetical protein